MIPKYAVGFVIGHNGTRIQGKGQKIRTPLNDKLKGIDIVRS